ncbi:MFS general substrate transporter [Gloeophyllum trabeum ATCC 11539]|uniref:MFS general substrate transporter n=1 Tax=Gloeophyllum trabeum (strain ATCC 11539 / FP-39264 / Madison 617) TaxID=670483 RepID=S7PYY5_GLOTA|nr:MFS general substrate transporter [Gloeophyllum trabeum ATCC 11539]EPQ52861.1 MFS general substrate transporter [Gloeophyllum trabeum ATCC 11539]
MSSELATLDRQEAQVSGYQLNSGGKRKENPPQLPKVELDGGNPSGFRLFMMALALSLAIYIVALDQTVISPATATITNDFHALQDVGWYASGYLLTSTVLQPFFGRLYGYFSMKLVFIASTAVFEIGSLICALARNSPTFVVGRAIAGIGVAGVYIGVLVIVSVMMPLQRKSLAGGLIGAIYGVGAITGPLIGGALTAEVTWRWCFWLNLPIGAVTLGIISLFLREPHCPQTESIPRRLMSIDWLGIALLHGSVISLLIALQNGGVRDAWGAGVTIAELVVFGVLLLVFMALQVYLGERATVPVRLFKNRTIFAATTHNFAVGATYFSLAYFLPIYFQAVLGTSALGAGIHTLPLIIATIVSIIATTTAVTFVGYVPPFMIFGSTVASIGTGLIHLLSPTTSTSTGKWIGYQIIAGVGLGTTYQLAYVASQTVLSAADVEVGTAIVVFSQTLGGCLFVSISQSIYQNKFLKNLGSVPGVDIPAVIAGGMTTFRSTVPENLLPQVIVASSRALRDAMTPSIALACLAFVSSLFIEWKSTRGHKGVVATAA